MLTWITHADQSTQFEVIPLDNYDSVIGMDFPDRIRALIVPSMDYIRILDTKRQHVVSVKRSNGKGMKMLSAMQFTMETR